jgi:hypothetical protein
VRLPKFSRRQYLLTLPCVQHHTMPCKHFLLGIPRSRASILDLVRLSCYCTSAIEQYGFSSLASFSCSEVPSRPAFIAQEACPPRGFDSLISQWSLYWMVWVHRCWVSQVCAIAHQLSTKSKLCPGASPVAQDVNSLATGKSRQCSQTMSKRTICRAS